MDDLPNNGRNLETAMTISQAKNSDLGPQADKHSGIANALASLDVAESLQYLQLQIVKTSKENRVSLDNAVSRIIKSNENLAVSNDRHSDAMKWLTGALVVVGILQIVITYTKGN